MAEPEPSRHRYELRSQLRSLQGTPTRSEDTTSEDTGSEASGSEYRLSEDTDDEAHGGNTTRGQTAGGQATSGDAHGAEAPNPPKAQISTKIETGNIRARLYGVESMHECECTDKVNPLFKTGLFEANQAEYLGSIG